MHDIGKCDRREIATSRFDNQANHRAFSDVENAVLKRERTDRRVEERVVLHVVDVMIDVVVHPPRRDGGEPAIVAAALTLAHFIFSPKYPTGTPATSTRNDSNVPRFSALRVSDVTYSVF